MASVYIPGIGKVNFPSDMSHIEMEAIINKNWPDLKFATAGELGDIAVKDNNISKETSITIQDKRLNENRWTNIPTQVKGQTNVTTLAEEHKPTEQQQELAIQRAIDRVSKGEILPSYESLDEATAAAQRRTKELLKLRENNQRVADDL